MTSPDASAPSPAAEAPRPAAVLVDAPRADLVPPELLEHLGPAHALRLRRVVARRTLAALARQGFLPEVWFTPSDAEPEVRRWLGPELTLRARAPGGIGATVPFIAQAALGRGGWLLARPVEAGLPDHVAAAAREALEEGRVALGATPGGGIYLLAGASALVPLAATLPWGAPDLADRLRDALASRRLPLVELPRLDELRTAEDLRRADLLT